MPGSRTVRRAEIATCSPILRRQIEIIRTKVVCALGKFGGWELTASSDLDLMLIYEPESDTGASLAPRFVQRLIAALSAPTEEGALYEVDMQLRPSGRAGPVWGLVVLLSEGGGEPELTSTMIAMDDMVERAGLGAYRHELIDIHDEQVTVVHPGADGFRLDAVPYLFERDGTNGENHPDTHEYLRRLRKAVDDEFAGKILLAEANQWPADVVDYFGDGDECHMCFHFPLMPRMFMSVRREQRYPITEILAQTPAIPDGAQWGTFLRNHDELTLEMVTDEERDYMYMEYAKDPRMKLNLGIRRRLAPLLDGGRDEIELMHAILFSLPGSPVLYYGDEIGMGDNVYLGDRDGVRTPMQWTGDRNGGFSRADFAQLFLPPLMDPVFGFQAVNVEAQLRSPTSLLRWLQRFVALRKQHPVFGLGTYEALETSNPRVFAHVRTHEHDTVLCVHNLARSAQAVELDLSAYEGYRPVEVFGRSRFPRIGELPYLLTLAPRGFYWFQLVKDEAE